MTTKLSAIQSGIVDHGDGALLVVAGPGSGKTRVLTERVRRLLTSEEGHFRILALTFTNKAANEMKERLFDVPGITERAFIGTLHSFCVEVLSNRGSAVGIDGVPIIFESLSDRRQVLIQAASEDPDLRLKLLTAGTIRDQGRLVQSWLDEIGEAKSQLLTPDLVENPTVRRAYEAYNAGLRASGAVDFDDLLFLTHRLFEQRPKIADFYRRQYRYICIDEAQDLNEAQYMVLRALCGDQYKNVMMVGDPRQAIFSWNGGSPGYLDIFQRDFDAKRVEMKENYRSSREIVRIASALAPDYTVYDYLPIPGEVVLLNGQDEEEEAEEVLRRLITLVNGGHPDVEGPVTLGRCAVLARTRYALTAIEGKLKARGIPYYKQVSNRHESESDLVVDFELCLRVVANPRDQLHLKALSSRWKVESLVEPIPGGIFSVFERVHDLVHEPRQRAVLEAILELRTGAGALPLSRALDHLDKFAKAIVSREERALVMEDLRAWRNNWDWYVRQTRGGQQSLPQFLGTIALGSSPHTLQDALALLTIHSSKGMEFDVVFVMGMVEGVFPDYRAEGKLLEEEQRNAFVACTRSRRLLYFSYPETRQMPWGDVRRQTPSRYLRIAGVL